MEDRDRIYNFGLTVQREQPNNPLKSLQGQGYDLCSPRAKIKYEASSGCRARTGNNSRSADERRRSVTGFEWGLQGRASARENEGGGIIAKGKVVDSGRGDGNMPQLIKPDSVRLVSISARTVSTPGDQKQKQRDQTG